jgi:hypothetical protein
MANVSKFEAITHCFICTKYLKLDSIQEIGCQVVCLRSVGAAQQQLLQPYIS